MRQASGKRLGIFGRFSERAAFLGNGAELRRDYAADRFRALRANRYLVRAVILSQPFPGRLPQSPHSDLPAAFGVQCET